MLLSIIIPVYNVEKYIRKTLDSIFQQEFDQNQVEVIIVNDGTPDGSMKIVEEFASCHRCIRILQQENQGLSAARNTGLSAATGDYVWFVDSDDWIEDGFLGKCQSLLQERDDDVLLFRIREHDEESGNVVLERSLLSNSEICNTDFLELMERKVDYTPMQLYLIRRQFMEEQELSFIPGIIHEDMEFAPRMLVLAKRIATVPLFHYNYLWRKSGSLTSSATNRQKRICSLLKIIDLHSRLLERNKESKAEKTTPDFTVISRRNQKALQMVQFWLYRKMFNYMNFEEFCGTEEELKKRSSEMKALVRKNFFYKATFMMKIHRLMFLVSPRWLKSRGKGF